MSNALLSLAAWSARILPTPIKKMMYRFPPFARLIRDSLNKAVPSGFKLVEVAGGDLRGMKLELNLKEEKDYWLGTYEPELQKAIRSFVEPGAVVFDIGANIGYISLLFARQVGERGKVFAFEALPANVERLRSNISQNGLQQQVQVIEAAVVNQSNPVQFHIGPSGGMGKAKGSAGRDVFNYQTSIEVVGISLDDFCFQLANPAPEVIKIDIEGGEVLALPGMREVLERARPLVFIELHGAESARVAWETFTSLNYQPCLMERGYPPVKSLDQLGWKSYLVVVPNGR